MRSSFCRIYAINYIYCYQEYKLQKGGHFQMGEFWQNFILTFVPLFIVIDALGKLPLVIYIRRRIDGKERRKMINVATVNRQRGRAGLPVPSGSSFST